MTSSRDSAPGYAGALPIPADRTRWFLVCLIGGLILIQCGLLILVHVFGRPNVFGLVDVFDFGGEHNFTALVSTLLMLSCAAMLALTGRLTTDRASALPWFILSAVFVFLAVDEATMIHEYLSAPMRSMLHADWVPHLAWVLPYGAAMIVLAAVLVPWFLKLDRQSQIRFVVAGSLFVLGAVGFELLESQQVAGILADHPDTDIMELQDPSVDMLILFEESLELIGLGIFLHALVRRMGGVTVKPGA